MKVKVMKFPTVGRRLGASTAAAMFVLTFGAASGGAGLAESAGTTLQRIQSSGVVVIGHRESSLPMSYVANGTPLATAWTSASRLRRRWGATSSCARPRWPTAWSLPAAALMPLKKARWTWNVVPPPTRQRAASGWHSPLRISLPRRASWCKATSPIRASKTWTARRWHPRRAPPTLIRWRARRPPNRCACASSPPRTMPKALAGW